MYTCSFVAIAAFCTAWAPPTTPVWLTDYDAAQEMVKEQKKPLAVFLGKGTDGWNRVSEKKSLSSTTKQLLAEKYVCVYVNLSEAEGKKLARSFKIQKGPGLIISDSTGRVQAFRHEGNLSNAELYLNLDRHADPNAIVRATRTLATRVSRAAHIPLAPLARKC